MNTHTMIFEQLHPGDTALLAEAASGRWNKEERILSTNKNGKSNPVADKEGQQEERVPTKEAKKTGNPFSSRYPKDKEENKKMTEFDYAEAQEQDARWRIKERAMMKRHLREQTQLLFKQKDEKLKLIVARRNISVWTNREVATIELQLTSQMNLESRQVGNCTLLGKQNEVDKKALKSKLWADKMNPKQREMEKRQPVNWCMTRTGSGN